MKILRRIPTTIAMISVMVTVASCQAAATDWTIIEATPQKLVLDIHTVEGMEEVRRLGAEHCKKFDKFAGQPKVSINMSSNSSVATIPCY